MSVSTAAPPAQRTTWTFTSWSGSRTAVHASSSVGVRLSSAQRRFPRSQVVPHTMPMTVATAT